MTPHFCNQNFDCKDFLHVSPVLTPLEGNMSICLMQLSKLGKLVFEQCKVVIPENEQNNTKYGDNMFGKGILLSTIMLVNRLIYGPNNADAMAEA